MYEGVARLVPAQLEAGGERGDPDFADRRVGRDHELRLCGFLEDNFKLSRFALDIETMFIAGGEHAALQVLERRVRFSLKVFFIEHANSVHEESRAWIVDSGVDAKLKVPKLGANKARVATPPIRSIHTSWRLPEGTYSA